MGALSHIFGRKQVLTFCIISFMVGIIISSVARNFTVMLAGRTLQGVGGGGIILLNDIIITDLVPMRLRGAYFGMIGAVWAVGSVSGPVVGGALAYRASWVSFPAQGKLWSTARSLPVQLTREKSGRDGFSGSTFRLLCFPC